MSKSGTAAKAVARAKLVRERKNVARIVWWATLAARLFGYGLLAFGINESRFHITEVGLWWGLTAREAMWLFVFIDVTAVFGKLLSLPVFSHRTRRKGYIIFGVCGTLSLAFNVGAGLIARSFGRAMFGAAIIGFLALVEWATVDIKGKTVRIPSEEDGHAEPAPAALLVPPGAASTAPSQPAPARRCTPGCTCGRHRRAGRIPQPPAAAPVSPGSGPVNGILVPDLATVRQVAGVR